MQVATLDKHGSETSCMLSHMLLFGFTAVRAAERMWATFGDRRRTGGANGQRMWQTQPWWVNDAIKCASLVPAVGRNIRRCTSSVHQVQTRSKYGSWPVKSTCSR